MGTRYDSAPFLLQSETNRSRDPVEEGELRGAGFSVFEEYESDGKRLVIWRKLDGFLEGDLAGGSADSGEQEFAGARVCHGIRHRRARDGMVVAVEFRGNANEKR